MTLCRGNPGPKLEPVMDSVGNVIMVMSGKGGVGKSTVTVLLALYLSQKGLRIGILDADLCGPSIPRMLNIVRGSIEQGENGWKPIDVGVCGNALKAVSMSFLLQNEDSAVIWRGPKKTTMINQFINSVDWGTLDVLLIDTPPGTSDEHLAVAQGIAKSRAAKMGAVIVTTPQIIALQDVDKQISFCKELQVPIFGLIENLSGYICKKCSHCNNIFSSGGGLQLADKWNIKFLGRLPIIPALGTALDGRSDDLLNGAPDLACFEAIGDQIVELVE